MSQNEEVPWHKNDALFRQLQNTGRRFEGYVAGLLVSHGFGVRVKPMATRPDVSVRREYRDHRDLIVECSSGQLAEIEVKSRDLAFSSCEDFPYQDLFVDVKSTIDEKGPPLAFVCVSQKTLGMIVIPGSSKEHWTTRTAFDRVRRQEQTWYVCPKDRTRSFENLCSHLRSL